MTSPHTEITRTSLSLTSLAKYTVRAWFMSLHSEEIVVVKFFTNSGAEITFAEFLRGRKLP